MALMLSHVFKPIEAVIAMPGSKSITNRALLLSALAKGQSSLRNVLWSDDTCALIQALKVLGIEINANQAEAVVTITGAPFGFPHRQGRIDCDEAGTVARFLLAICANQSGEFYFDGKKRLRERPLYELIRVLRDQGAHISANALPLVVSHQGSLRGGDIFVHSKLSSQFLSALLMMAPYCRESVYLHTDDIVSRPYIDMTLQMMKVFGVEVEVFQQGWRLNVPQYYQARDYWIEPDFSSASYFFAAAAVTGGCVTIPQLSLQHSLQGDKQFLRVLEAMGCKVSETLHGLKLQGPGELRGVDVDMRDFSDTMMTLAAIAPFAVSPTCIRGVGNTRVKESDRIAAMSHNLRRLGIRVEEEAEGLTIYPGCPQQALIETYKDHRIAMAAAVLGLKTPGLRIDDETCVSKTFPDFFKLFASLGV